MIYEHYTRIVRRKQAQVRAFAHYKAHLDDYFGRSDMFTMYRWVMAYG